MHIAILDDNVADRKQLERLLGRESDARKAVTGVFYTDSFGEGDKLLSKRMSYDLFFIDVVDENTNGLMFALELCKSGVLMPIVMCSSKTDYYAEASKIDDLPKNILFLNKPIVKAQLSAVLDQAIDIEQNQEKTIELRDKTDTYYVKEDDLVYIREEGRFIYAGLKTGEEIEVLDSILNFGQALSEFDHFLRASNKLVVNIAYVDQFTLFSVKLKGGQSFKINLTGFRYLKIMSEYYKKELEERK